MNKVYFEGFTCLDDLKRDFYLEDDLKDIDIIYALYDGPGYEGYAHVIFLKDRKLFEINASHCSCHGLEDQWKPEETTLNALLFRPNVSDDAKKNLKERFKNLIAFL